MSKYDIIAAGLIFNETIQYPDRKITGLMGSTVAYGAMALGRLGCNAGIVTKAGYDLPSDFFKPLEKCGIDLNGIIRSDNYKTTSNILIYDNNGNKTLEYIFRSPDIGYEEIPKEYLDCDIFFLSCIDFEISSADLRRIKELGIVVAADIGGLGGAHVSTATRKKLKGGEFAAFMEYAPYIDILKASEEDLIYINGGLSGGMEEYMDALCGFGAKISLLTAGAKGAYISDGKERRHILPYKANPIDATGAGDTFMAAFLCGYHETGDIEYSAKFASAASALLIQKTGGVSLDRTPDKASVLRKMQEGSD